MARYRVASVADVPRESLKSVLAGEQEVCLAHCEDDNFYAIDDVKSASFTTVDVALRYATDRRDDAWSGMEFALSVDNAFDRDPPLYQVGSPLYAAPYDSTNYSAIGRFLSLSVSKHW